MNIAVTFKMTSSKTKMPDAEIPDIIFDPARPHRKYERGKFLGKVRQEDRQILRTKSI